MAKTFFEPDEKGRMKITESKGSKKPISETKIAGRVGFPHSNVRIDTGVNAETGKTYKRVLPDLGATRVKGPMKKPNGKPTRKALALRRWKC